MPPCLYLGFGITCWITNTSACTANTWVIGKYVAGNTHGSGRHTDGEAMMTINNRTVTNTDSYTLSGLLWRTLLYLVCSVVMENLQRHEDM